MNTRLPLPQDIEKIPCTLTLDLLRAGGAHRVADLARELETTPVLVEVMLEGLDRMEYLKRVGGECGETRGACPMAGLCAAGGGGRV